MRALISAADDELNRLWVHWLGLLREHVDVNDAQGNFRTESLRLAHGYARIYVLSFGLDLVFEDQDSTTVKKVRECAKS